MTQIRFTFLQNRKSYVKDYLVLNVNNFVEKQRSCANLCYLLIYIYNFLLLVFEYIILIPHPLSWLTVKTASALESLYPFIHNYKRHVLPCSNFALAKTGPSFAFSSDSCEGSCIKNKQTTNGIIGKIWWKVHLSAFRIGPSPLGQEPITRNLELQCLGGGGGGGGNRFSGCLRGQLSSQRVFVVSRSKRRSPLSLLSPSLAIRVPSGVSFRKCFEQR